jgi:hypothetical protein
VFETKIEQKVKTENNDVNANEKDKKEKNKGTEKSKEGDVEGEEEEGGNRRNPDGTMRGVLVAVCPLYVKYNRWVHGLHGIMYTTY